MTLCYLILVTRYRVTQNNKKAQLTQKERSTAVHVKAHCDQKLSLPIQAVDIRHDGYEGW